MKFSVQKTFRYCSPAMEKNMVELCGFDVYIRFATIVFTSILKNHNKLPY